MEIQENTSVTREEFVVMFFFLFVIVVVVVVVAGTQWCLCGIEKGASATKYFKTVGLQGKGK